MTDRDGGSAIPSRTKLSINRRQFVHGAAAGVALPAVIGSASAPARAQAKTVNVASYGGVVQEYQTRLFAQPFEAKTGIKVNIGSNASLALVKLQNAAGTTAQWDICSLSGAEYFEAIAQKLIVSEKTVNHHVSAVLRKLEVSTRGEASAKATREGLV